MKRCVTTAAFVVLCLATLRADLTFVQTMTFEGPMAAMMPSNEPMTMTTYVKGTRSRTDMKMMGMSMSSITDVRAKQVTLLNHAEKTAQVLSTATPLVNPNTPMPSFDVSFKTTGQTREIDGVSTNEHVFTVAMNMGEMSGGQMPPEAAQMMKDVRLVMNGSIWIAKGGPGSAEYMAFQKAAVDANLSAMLGSILGGQPGKSAGGLDKVFAAISEAPGLPYLTEISMSVEGTGPMVDMMKQQMSGMKMIQKTTKITTDAISDDLFTVPADYTKK